MMRKIKNNNIIKMEPKFEEMTVKEIVEFAKKDPDNQDGFAYALKSNNEELFNELMKVCEVSMNNLNNWESYTECPLFHRYLIENKELFSSTDFLQYEELRDLTDDVFEHFSQINWLRSYLLNGLPSLGERIIDMFEEHDELPSYIEFVWEHAYRPHRSVSYSRNEFENLGKAFKRCIELGYKPGDDYCEIVEGIIKEDREAYLRSDRGGASRH